LLPLAVVVECLIALVDHSADLRADMGTKLDDLRAKLLEVIVDVPNLLLLSQVSGFQLPKRSVNLHLEVRLQLLHMRNYRLLLAVKMSNRLLVLPLY
jgi:hypothetical protein